MIKLGILGGGQLAQMLTQAAISLGIETAIFERTADSPAARLTQHSIVGQWDDESALSSFAALCDVVTLENEFVDAGVLRRLEAMGLPVYPASATLAQLQDKLIQKQAMAVAGLPVPAFCAVESPDDVAAAGQEFGYPMVLKARRDGYDGYGNATLHTPVDILPAWEKLSKGGRALYVEAFVPFKAELAVMVVRSQSGVTRIYPVVETVQQNHICHVVRAPAPISPEIAEKAASIAQKAVETVNGVGIFGVEFFLLENGDIVYNEIAPRPHNSGHYTIEGCVTSQFENHIRAVLGWPLGKIDLRAPAVVMVNILGRRNGEAKPDSIKEALAVPHAHLHLYGKRDSRIGRKMGHVTVLANTLLKAESVARQAAEAVDL
jgi:5-(carboxyamino)imidazole ribonucleotide synthase